MDISKAAYTPESSCGKLPKSWNFLMRKPLLQQELCGNFLQLNGDVYKRLRNGPKHLEAERLAVF